MQHIMFAMLLTICTESGVRILNCYHDGRIGSFPLWKRESESCINKNTAHAVWSSFVDIFYVVYFTQ